MYHAAFVLPAVFACYKTDGNLKKDNAYLHRLIGAPDALYARNGQYTHMVDLQTESQRWAI